MPKRCVNIDWLEVHAREPKDACLNAAFFKDKGYYVVPRDYGTRVYKEMFVVYGSDGKPCLEIRRNPASQGIIGIHDPEECHIRLVNRTCYFNNAVELLKNFLEKFNYERVRISRIDICMDFDKFDRGDLPEGFVRKYFKHRYCKINQCNIAGRGADSWNGQEWNSVSWGSKASQVSTKLYNKTKELYDLRTGTFAKPYILQAWFAAGFIDNIATCTKNSLPVDMWRLEFSLVSPKINWIKLELDGKQRKYQSLRHCLETYDNRSKLLVMFASLVNHYFRFKYFDPNKRKDRCKDKVLFEFSDVEEIYKIQREDYAFTEDSKRDMKWLKLISMLIDFKKENYDPSIRKAANEILERIQWDIEHANLVSPWSDDELREFEDFVHHKMDENLLTEFVLSNDIREMLNIKERTLTKFKPIVKND